MLLKFKLNTSASFKAIKKQMLILDICVETINETPSNMSIMNWVHKVGYYELTKPKEISDDWIIIPDHSIQLGQEKLFVVFGIRESQINFNRPLQFHDLTPLIISSKEKWTGEIINEYFNNLKRTLGKIKYAVGDYGSDIKKGLELSGIIHVHDITHKMANIVEKIYKNNPQYQEFTKKMAEMRIKLGQTLSSHIIPPNQRKKSRYLNIDSISKWATKALSLIESKRNQKEDKSVIENLHWLKEYRRFVEELSMINETICQIEKIVKHNGISKSSIKKCNNLCDNLINSKGEFLRARLKEYFNTISEKLSNHKNILCTSDIIESAFGKYKSYLSNNPMACLTNLSLCIAAFTGNLTDNEVKEALEAVKVKDIKKWTEENIGTSLLSKRRRALVA